MRPSALKHEHWAPEGEPCTVWCYDYLPERRGAMIIHGHDEGENCSLADCYYKPRLGRRLRRVLEDHPAAGVPLIRVLSKIMSM